MESRLLQLPEDIFHRIMYNDHLLSDPAITNRAAIRLSLVSKEFLTAVQRRPVLVFGDQIYHSQERKYIISTLTRYRNENIHLDTFIFSCLCPDHQTIELATAKNLGLKNLNICMQYNYVLPKPVFEAESLVQLELRRCSLQPGESIIMWHNLKRLSLWFVTMGDKEVFENILRGCSLLEFLEIVHCSFKTSNSNVKVSNLGYLKKLDIQLYLDQTFELGAAPNLECLDCSKGNLRFLGKYEYRKLKSIKLSNLRFNGDFLINLAHQFPVLEALTLSYINLEKINISSPSLKTLKMTYIRGLQEASFDVPNVVLFTFENNVVPTDSKHTLGFFIKLKEFFAAINMAEASIHVSFKFLDPNIKFEARAQKSSASFPGIIQDLTVQDFGGVSLPFVRKFLDGILLIFRPQRITMILNWQDCEFPKLLYDHLMKARALMRNVTRVELLADESRMNGSWHRVLEQPQVSDRDKFMELFKDVVDDRDNKFTISFDLKY